MNHATRPEQEAAATVALDNFGDCMARLGWTQREVSSRMGVDRSTVSRWLSGQAPVPLWAVRAVRAIVLLQAACPAAVRHLLTQASMTEALENMPAQRLAYQRDRSARADD